MKIPKKFRYLLSLLCVAILSGPYLLYKGLYWHGLSYLPEERQPIRDDTLPDHLLELSWKEFRGTGPRRMVPIRFDHYIKMFIQAYRGELMPTLTQSSTASSQVARILLSQRTDRLPIGEWHLANASAVIWLSQHWTIDETLSTILHFFYYGHDMYGIAQAAQGYFAKTPAQLSPQESAVLIAITHRPALLEPWCHSKDNLQRANRLLLKLSRQSAMQEFPTTLVSAPAGACSK